MSQGTINLAEYVAPPPIDRAALAERCQKAWRVADFITKQASAQVHPQGSDVKFVMMSNALNSATNEIVRMLEAGADDYFIRESAALRQLAGFEEAQSELFAALS